MKFRPDATLRAALIEGTEATGREVLAIYARDFSVGEKGDKSPLTEADIASHEALTALLQELTPDLPILSEESGDVSYAVRSGWDTYWLIDPLDGTKEFINRNGEFTLNLALVEHGVPVLGVVHAPVLRATWWGQQDEGAWKRLGDEPPRTVQVRALPDPGVSPWKIVGSRSHGAAQFEQFCAHLPRNERVSMGSSLKLCLVAEGEADLYPRLAPTCEWDTAAAQAVVTAAGGQVLNAETLQELKCNQQDSVLNPSFIVCGERDARWESALKRSGSNQQAVKESNISLSR